MLGVFEVRLRRGQDSFCSSLGLCGGHMGKHDEAVTGTLCVADLDARLRAGSPPRSILAFLKGDFMREMAFFFHFFSVSNTAKWEGREHLRLGGLLKLDCGVSFFLFFFPSVL